MALGALLILFIILTVVSILTIGLLFLVKDPQINNIVFFVTAVLGIVISYMAFTSLPSNFTVSRMVAGFFGLLTVIGVVMKFMQKAALAKLFVSVSVVLGMLQLFFF